MVYVSMMFDLKWKLSYIKFIPAMMPIGMNRGEPSGLCFMEENSAQWLQHTIPGTQYMVGDKVVNDLIQIL